MKTKQIIDKINTIPSGKFFRLRYITKAKLPAEVQKQGISIFKIVDTTTRTGIKYTNIKDVILNDENKTVKRKSNWLWVSKDRIKHNTQTRKDYLVVAPIKMGSNTKVTYIMTDGEGKTSIIDKDTAQLYVLKSYIKDETPKIINITLENILSVRYNKKEKKNA